MEIGEKLREERVRQDWSSGSFASASTLSVDRLREIEDGSFPTSHELDCILFTLRKPLAWVNGNDLPLITSRYLQVGTKKPSSIEYVLDRISSDIRYLLDAEIIQGTERPDFPKPTNHDEAARLAGKVRRIANLDDKEPVTDISALCAHFGLWEFGVHLDGGPTDTPGLMVETTGKTAAGSIGVTVIDSSKLAFHQRFVLAHELCHWLIGDEFEGTSVRPDVFDIEKDGEEPLGVEEACSSFAAHLLLPDRAMAHYKSDKFKVGEIAAAVALAKKYGMGWRSTVDLLMSAGQISALDADRLRNNNNADAQVILAQVEPAKNRVAADYLAQLNKAVEAGKITQWEAEGFSYGASPDHVNS